jgi:hypothetical protein
MTTADLEAETVAREKAFNALIDAVDVYKAFRTLKRAWLVDSDGEGLERAVYAAAADLNAAERAYATALHWFKARRKRPPVEYKSRKLEPDTFERVKAAIIAAQKRAPTEVVRAVVLRFGGHTGDGRPSLKAIPPEHHSACLAALEALPG